jgi:hypothetical protein
MSKFINVQQPPKSSVVYVVYAVDQKKVYILSRSVNMLYHVLKSQFEDDSDPPLSNEFYMKWTWQHGDDHGGFFDGVPPDSLLDLINGKSRPTLFDRGPTFFDCADHSNEATNCIIVPYQRIDMEDDLIHSLFDGNGNIPSLDDIKNEYSNLSPALNNSFGVSIPKYVSNFIFVKIDQLAWYGSYEVKYGKAYVETMLSGPMKKDDLKLVKKMAVNIVRAAVDAPPKHGNEISKEIRDIIIDKSVNWQIVMKKHVIIE